MQNMSEGETRTRELFCLRADHCAHQVDALVGFSIEENGVLYDIIFAAPRDNHERHDALLSIRNIENELTVRVPKF